MYYLIMLYTYIFSGVSMNLQLVKFIFFLTALYFDLRYLYLSRDVEKCYIKCQNIIKMSKIRINKIKIYNRYNIFLTNDTTRL